MNQEKTDDLNRIGSIVTKMELDTIQLKNLHWKCKMIVNGTLPKAYRSYNVELILNEDPYLKRIDEVQTNFENSIFSQDTKERVKHDKEINEMKVHLDKLRKETEEIKFTALVEELKYRNGDTVLVMNIPDDVIQAFNRQKTRFDIYQLTLVPINF